MRKQTFVISAIILTLGGFFAKAIGALYKIPLTNILGSSGMGVYYLIFPIYSLIISLCSSGVSVALTCEVAKCRKIRHKFNEQKLLRVSLLLSFFSSLIFAIIIIFSARYLASLQGNVNAYTGYIAIAPSIILSCLIATLRGYFQGIENMIPTTISLIVEQIVKLGLGLILAHKFCVYGIEYAVLGAVLGVTLSEVVALIIIVINFLLYKGQLDFNFRNICYKPKRKIQVPAIIKSKRHLVKTNYKSKKNHYVCNSKWVKYTNSVAIKKILKIALPTTLSSILIPISSMLDTFMIINLLFKSGYSMIVSTSLYGLWGGVIQSLISLPTIVISAITTSLVPSLSGLVYKNDTNEIRKKVAFYIKLTWVLSIFMFVCLYVFSPDILRFFYGEGLNDGVLNELEIATNMLKISSLSIIYYAFLQTFTSILQTIGKSHVPFLTLLFAVVLRTFMVFVLTQIPSINIYGVVISNIVYLGISDMVLACVIIRKIELNLNGLSLFKPLLYGIILLSVLELSHMALQNVLGYINTTIILALVSLIVYPILVYFGKVFNSHELKLFGKKKLTNAGKFKEKV